MDTKNERRGNKKPSRSTICKKVRNLEYKVPWFVVDSLKLFMHHNCPIIISLLQLQVHINL